VQASDRHLDEEHALTDRGVETEPTRKRSLSAAHGHQSLTSSLHGVGGGSLTISDVSPAASRSASAEFRLTSWKITMSKHSSRNSGIAGEARSPVHVPRDDPHHASLPVSSAVA